MNVNPPGWCLEKGAAPCYNGLAEVTMRAFYMTMALLGMLAAGGMAAAAVANPDVPEETAVSLLLKYKAQEKPLAKAEKLLKKHQAAEAEASLRQCLKGVPEHYEAHYLLARMAADRQDYTAALGHMERAEAELDRLAGLCRAWQEEHAREETAERELVSGDATKASTIQSLCRAAHGKVDTGSMDREAGIAPVSSLAPLNPKRFEIPASYLFVHGNFLFKSRRWPEAATRYRQAVERDPRLAAAWNNLLSALLLAGQNGEARATLDRAVQAGVQLNPDLRRAVEAAAPR
jgi:tetratricopeptide (TPR) repeat protein